MPHSTSLDPALTINEIVTRFPDSIPVFNHFGLDMCCGGDVTLEEAARRDGLDAKVLTDAVRVAVEGQ